ncbi:MAG: FUSC family membrane protein [Panacibacter sp.]
MDYIKEYKKFVNSHYLSEGVRITAGVALPAIVLSYFGLLSAGIVVSLGAMSVSVTDNPGPIHHRRNGMTACACSIFIVSLVTGFVAPHPLLLGIAITVFCFIFSMAGVYGSRAISLGVSSLIVMVLNIDRHHEGWDVLLNATYILAGGAWYTILSLLLFSIRPYKLIQQALGDCITAVAEYLRTRSDFYNKGANYESSYQQMLEQQITLHEKQNLIRELLFKSHDIIKEPTIKGRILVMMFLEMNDLIETVMTSYDYETLHQSFDESGILQKYRQLIIGLSKELDGIGIAIKSGRPSDETGLLQTHINETKEYLNAFIETERTADNVEAFIGLRHILNNIEGIAARIHTLHLYSTYDQQLTSAFPAKIDYDKFITHTDTSVQVLLDNLTLKSNIFRHALRVSIATLAGYLASMLLPFGHSYWILLTIIVILKPAYSLTKKRNYQRVIGTVAGALAGLMILFLVTDKTGLFVIMLLLMIGTYSFIRTNYMVSVFFMTPYILLLFHLLNSGNFETIIFDRVTDTAIGSAVAFAANFLLLPAWEHEQIKNYMAEALEDNMNYFRHISAAFIGKPFTITQYKLSRKNAFVLLANLSDAFSRMLSEPKSKQKNSKLVQQFVMLNHMLTSHIATLAYYVKPLSEKYSSPDFDAAINSSVMHLQNAKNNILQVHTPAENVDVLEQSNLGKRVNTLLEKRREELQNNLIETDTRKILSEFKSVVDQFSFITKITTDLEKISGQL